MFSALGLPDADAVFICGDITNWGLKRDLITSYQAGAWIDSLVKRYKRVFWIPGNHDWSMNDKTFNLPGLTCLMDETVDIDGYKVHGVALTVAYNMPELAIDWDYMTTNPEAERLCWDFEAVDIVVSHGPPFGTLDSEGGLIIDENFNITPNGEHLGSEKAREYVEQKQPKLFVCGHIHGARGIDEIGATTVINTACSYALVDLESMKILTPMR